MILDTAHAPLRLDQTAQTPKPTANEVLIGVHACGVCGTDLHILDGELAHPKLPLVFGPEIVGTVLATGSRVEHVREGERVGVPWLRWTCGSCVYCSAGEPDNRSAQRSAEQRGRFHIREDTRYDKAKALIRDRVLGIAAIDLISGKTRADAQVLTVCAGIHMSDIPSFSYQLLWEERAVRPVANLTRQYGAEFLGIAPPIPVRTTTVPFALDEANQARARLREGEIVGRRC